MGIFLKNKDMALHLQRGKTGEQIACGELERRGFEIIARNWRNGNHEIDIIAQKNNTLHFIEVKTRHSLKFGYPEEAVTKKKFENLKLAAVAFLNQNPFKNCIQFDILSVLCINEKPVEFFFIEDVYL
jgi:putative endonuclease